MVVLWHLSDLHWEVSAPHPSSQTRLLHGGRCLSLSAYKDRKHKNRDTVHSRVVNVLAIIISTHYTGKWYHKEETGNTKGETFWVYAYHLVHFATNNYVVEKSKHFPAHRSMLMKTNRMQCLKKKQAPHPCLSREEERVKWNESRDL